MNPADLRFHTWVLAGCIAIFLFGSWLSMRWIIWPFMQLKKTQGDRFSIQLVDLFSLTFLIGLPMIFLGTIFAAGIELWSLWMGAIMLLMFSAVVWMWIRTCQWMTARSIQDNVSRVAFSCISIPGVFLVILLVPVCLLICVPQVTFYLDLTYYNLRQWQVNLWRWQMDWPWDSERYWTGIVGLMIAVMIAIGLRFLNAWIVARSGKASPTEILIDRPVVEPWSD